MADDEARARVAQLEKEKRQRDFQVRRAAARGAYASHALPGGGTPGSRGAGRRSRPAPPYWYIFDVCCMHFEYFDFYFDYVDLLF